MSLQFQAPFQINPYAETPQQKSLSGLNETVSGIGTDARQYAKERDDDRMKRAMLTLQQAQSARQGAETREDLGYDPASGEQPPQGPQPSGGLTQGTNGPQPNYSMTSGQDAYAPPDGSSPQPIDHTAHFNAWKGMGMPLTYDHPDYGGTGQGMGGNPMDRYSQVMSMPGRKNRAEALSMFKESDAHDLQNSEITKNNAMADYYLKTKGQPQSYLAGISWDTATPQQKGMAEAMLRGDIRPADLSFRDKGQIVSLAQERAQATGQPFQSYGGDVKRGVAEQFSYGKPAQNVNALNTALGHLDTLNTAFQEIGNSNHAWLNIPMNKLKTMTNDPSVIKLDATLNAVQGELSNVFKNGGATDHEIASWAQVFNRNLTPQQAIGVIKQADELLRSRVDSLQYQRDNGMRGGGSSGSLLSPKGAKLMQKFDGQGGGQPDTVQRKGKDGQTYTYTLNPQTGQYE